jgi:hypothetical protein
MLFPDTDDRASTLAKIANQLRQDEVATFIDETPWSKTL